MSARMGAGTSITSLIYIITVTSCLFCLPEGLLFLSASFAADRVVGVHDELAVHPPYRRFPLS